MVCAGEISGDLYGAALVRALRARLGANTEFFGLIVGGFFFVCNSCLLCSYNICTIGIFNGKFKILICVFKSLYGKLGFFDFGINSLVTVISPSTNYTCNTTKHTCSTTNIVAACNLRNTLSCRCNTIQRRCHIINNFYGLFISTKYLSQISNLTCDTTKFLYLCANKFNTLCVVNNAILVRRLKGFLDFLERRLRFTHFFC